MCRDVPENGNPVAVFQLPERFIAKRRKRCQRSKKTNGNHHARFRRNQVRDFPNLLNGAEEEAAQKIHRQCAVWKRIAKKAVSPAAQQISAYCANGAGERNQEEYFQGPYPERTVVRLTSYNIYELYPAGAMGGSRCPINAKVFLDIIATG